MTPFAIALIGCALATLGDAAALRVSRSSGALGRPFALLIAAWLAAGWCAAGAAWLGSSVGAGAPVFAAVLCLLAAAEQALRRAPAAPAEPTRSFGAILLVLTYVQATSAAAAIAAIVAKVTQEPLAAGLGAALGSGAVLAAAWSMGTQWERRLPLRAMRLGGAALLVLVGLAVLALGTGA